MRRKRLYLVKLDVPLFRFSNPGFDGILRDSIFSKCAIMITVKERNTGQSHRAIPDADPRPQIISLPDAYGSGCSYGTDSDTTGVPCGR